MKKKKLSSKTIDGVRIIVTPGNHPEFVVSKAMTVIDYQLWKERNKRAVNDFIMSIDPTILQLKTAKKPKNSKNSKVGDYTSSAVLKRREQLHDHV